MKFYWFTIGILWIAAFFNILMAFRLWKQGKSNLKELERLKARTLELEELGHSLERHILPDEQPH